MNTSQTILNVEDIPENRQLVRRILESQGYVVVDAENALEGIEKAVQLRPDLILMDMTLPVMSGWDATAALKDDERTRAIPVLALTAHSMSGDRDRALAAGCDDFDTKPVDLPRLLAKIDTLLGLP